MTEKKPTLVCNGHTQRCVEFFYKHIEHFGPVAKITSFFEPANFLLTPYQVDNNGIHTILENTRGEEMQLAGVNCGYGGTGPNGTREILIYLGVSSEDARQWMYYTSLSVDFTGDKPFLQPQFYPFFENRTSANTVSLHTSCQLDDFTHVNAYDRVVYMITPSLYNLHGFFNCLNIMQPTRVVYSLGREPLEISPAVSIDDLNILLRRSQESFKRKTMHLNMAEQVNFVVYGKRFHLVCCADENEILPLVYTTHYYLIHEEIKDEVVCGILSPDLLKKQSLFKAIQRLLFHKPPQNLIGSFDVPDDKSGRERLCQ